GICILVTFRDDEIAIGQPVAELLADFERERRLVRLPLPPLDLAGVGRMTAALLPDRDTTKLAAAVFRRSEGIPFYVEELLKTALDAPNPTAEDLTLPRTVRDSVLLRLSRLVTERGAGARDLLEALAVAGIPLAHDALVSLSGRAESDAAHDIAAAVDAQLLERSSPVGDIYQFRHALTRDAVASAISPSARRGLHLRVAEMLER